MSFRKLTCAFMLAALVSSCSWLRDKPKSQKGFESAELDLSCLNSMPKKLENLFAGRYTESPADLAEVKSLWDCIEHSLITFSKYTHGANEGYYTDSELQQFANRYLPEDSLFNNSLISSIFKMKKAVLGGSERNITKLEVAKLRVKMNRFGEIILPLAPHISVLLKHYSLTEGKMEAACDALNKFVSALAELLGDSENIVTWADMSFFVSEVEKYLDAPNPTALTVVREQIQIFQYLKLMVVGGQESGIERTKWQPIFKSISIIYNALYMSASTTEMMEQLGVLVQSTEAEQKIATEKLSSTLKRLKSDSTLYSKATIQLLSDRWSKAMVLNDFFYPSSRGRLAIGKILGSPVVRKLSANLIDEMTAIRRGDMSPALFDKFSDHLIQLIAQTGVNTLKMKNLLDLVEVFLPDGKKLADIGITPELAGATKVFLVGGQTDKLEAPEYNRIFKIGCNIFRNIRSVIQALPENFKMGLNSDTIAILEGVLQGFIDEKGAVFSNAALKQLLLTRLKMSGMPVQPQTIDKLLIGLNHRVLGQNKGVKPATFPPTFEVSKLAGIRQLLGKVKLDYQDLEKAFAGTDSAHSLEGSVIAKRLMRTDTKTVLGALHPIVNGVTMMPFFTELGRPQTDYYLADLHYKVLIYQALLWVFPFYEVEPDRTKPNNLPRLSMRDLLDLFHDVNDAVYELGLSFSPDSPAVSARNRMQSINLFTRTGNGDAYIDVIETTDFLTTTFGGKTLLDEVRKSLVAACYPQNLNYTSQDRFSYACLKTAFFGTSAFTRFYRKVVPQMTDHYAALTSDQREAYRKDTLTAVKAGWNENSEMKLSDLETLVSIPYYVENIFLRLDHNYNSVLNFSEAMSGFPVFCREIKKAAGDFIRGSCEPGEDPRQIEAIYGHLLFKGEPPEALSKDDNLLQKLRKVKDFLLWVYQWNRLERDPAVRDRSPPFLQRKDLLSVISNLATVIATPVSMMVEIAAPVEITAPAEFPVLPAEDVASESVPLSDEQSGQ